MVQAPKEVLRARLIYGNTWCTKRNPTRSDSHAWTTLAGTSHSIIIRPDGPKPPTLHSNGTRRTPTAAVFVRRCSFICRNEFLHARQSALSFTTFSKELPR